MAKVEREVFDRMDDDTLISVCFKPLIRSYKEISGVNELRLPVHASSRESA